MSMDNMKTSDLKVLLEHKERELENLRASNKALLEVCDAVARAFADAKYPGSIESRLRDMARAAIAKAKII
jgi:hypothetical protein